MIPFLNGIYKCDSCHLREIEKAYVLPSKHHCLFFSVVPLAITVNDSVYLVIQLSINHFPIKRTHPAGVHVQKNCLVLVKIPF